MTQNAAPDEHRQERAAALPLGSRLPTRKGEAMRMQLLEILIVLAVSALALMLVLYL